MDGSLVAYDVSSEGPPKAKCNRVVVWNVRTGAHKRVSGKGTCGADSTSTGAGVAELAVAGRRVAWIVNQGGNTESDDYLYQSSLPKPHEERLAQAARFGDVEGTLTGGWIHGLAGSGALLVVNRWQTDDTGAITSGRLVQIEHGLKPIASGPETMVASSVDFGRVAVRRSDDTIGLYSTSGDLLKTFAPPSPPRAIALGKRFLVVLTMADQLEVYEEDTGLLQHEWPVSGHWRRPGMVGSTAALDVAKGIAVYSTEHAVHAVRLATGKDVVLATKRQLLEDEVAIEAPGVVYSYDTFNRKTLRTTGHLVFAPLSEVLATIR